MMCKPKYLLAPLFVLLSITLYSQAFEVEGEVKVSVMSNANSADSIVVLLSDGTLAYRDAMTLGGNQVLSIVEDTLFLSGGGKVTLPEDDVTDPDSNPFNEIQNLSLGSQTGTVIPINISNGGGISIDVADNDNDVLNEIQSLSILDDTIKLSSGGQVTLPSDKVDDADADPSNEIQSLSILDDTIKLSSGGQVTLPSDEVDDADADPSNEIQTLSISNRKISLTNGGQIDLPSDNSEDADADPTNEYQNLIAGTGSGTMVPINISNGTGIMINVADNDNDPSNELQTLGISGNKISLTNGGEVTLPADMTDDADADPTNEYQDLSLGAPSGTMVPVNISDGNGVTINVADNDNDANNELQALNAPLRGPSDNIQTMSISDGNIVAFDVGDADSDAGNEIQTLTRSNDTLFLSDGGFVTITQVLGDDADADPTNEFQLLTAPLRGVGSTFQTLLISDGNFVAFDVADGDSDDSNEIQTLSISNDTLYISDGNGVYLGGLSALVNTKGESKSFANGQSDQNQIVKNTNDDVEKLKIEISGLHTQNEVYKKKIIKIEEELEALKNLILSSKSD